ncbi:hypothetical protein B4125_1542 [Bacillus paralicheniformis]|nr:hypothetical protein B4125_1542 [Bacillus paralicheniformis]TWM49455.1 hypothetical protein CHCC14817_3331 [Bacillus paralicheniformis]TWN65609.1 hypothetical protein CHCC12620_1308 [Bacillus paralicheniformis]TWN84996.1 hypothetical protein CHCC20491_0329 [Bacillus paralicheniformis]
MINENKAGTVFSGTIRICCLRQYEFFTVYRGELNSGRSTPSD